MNKNKERLEKLRKLIVSWGNWQHQDCDPMCSDKAFEDIDITDNVRELSELLSQAEDNMRKRCVEECIKELKGFHSIARTAYSSDSWDAGVHDVLFKLEKHFCNKLSSDQATQNINNLDKE